MNRTIRLFAAAAAFALCSISSASAGWWGADYGYGGYGFGGNGFGGGGCCAPPAPVVAPAPVANWGCGDSCAPLVPSYSGYSGCCAPVRWGCGSSCGFNFGSYGCGNGCGYNNGYSSYGYGYGYRSPIYVVQQGPLYRPPLTGYTYPVYADQGANVYPYVSRGYGYRYRPRVAHYPRYHSYGPRRGYPMMDLPPK
jgi:hypothetical protein